MMKLVGTMVIAGLVCGACGGKTEVGKGGDAGLDVVDVTAEVAVGVDGTDGEAGDSTVRVLAPAMIPGPDQEGYDKELEKLARLYDRQFHVFSAFGMSLNSDVGVPPGRTEDRELIRKFLQEGDGWDFEAETGKHQFDLGTKWAKIAGLYAGVGIAADAYRYGVLRDQGYAQEDVDVARQHLVDALEVLHIATAITGVNGVVVRGLIRTDIPSEADLNSIVPLFDDEGNPLPEVKNNGVWRADNSGGDYPNWIWEDSCSRDMYIGWVAGAGAAWEVIKDDATIPPDVKSRLQTDARDIGLQLMVVRKSGYDLELPDADGRTTLHGYLNESCVDSNNYIPGVRNGFHAVMALGSVAVWAWVSQDPQLESFLYDELMGPRELHVMVGEDMGVVNTGVGTNFSNFNMAFQGIWLALRYLDDSKAPSGARGHVQEGLAHILYDNGGPRQPAEMGQSLFDFAYAGGMSGASVFGVMSQAPDEGAMARGVQTLREFVKPPYWEFAVENCDAAELEAKHCLCVDGETEIDVIGEAGWKGSLVAQQVIPMRIRPPSNYFWRSNPYGPNGGGDGGRLMPGVDFRYAYWLGRWTR